MESHGAMRQVDVRPRVSVIIPVRNEVTCLPLLLASLAEQDFPSHEFEVIVSDGRSIDGTREMVCEFAQCSRVRITLVDNPGIRSSAGRNAGLNAARGEFILFIDGHCHLPSKSLLRETVELFQKTRAECLCRPQPLLGPAKRPLGNAIAAVRSSALGHGRDSLIYNMNASGRVDPASSGAAYHRSVFDITGPYDERFDACEDVEFNIRIRKAGMKAYTDPRLAVFYEPRATLGALWNQMVRYGRGRVRLMQKHPDSFSAGQTAPAFLLLWVLTATLFWLCSYPHSLGLRLALSAPVFGYLIVVMAFSATLARRHARLIYQAPAIYCVIHFGLGFGLWAELLRVIRRLLGGKREWIQSFN